MLIKTFIYSGNDDQTIDILKLGGVGVISVCSNLIQRIWKNSSFLFKW